MGKQLYRVRIPLYIGSLRCNPGDVVELDDATANRLLARAGRLKDIEPVNAAPEGAEVITIKPDETPTMAIPAAEAARTHPRRGEK
jgi:hypothetical protein